jgi:hypothetical protein
MTEARFPGPEEATIPKVEIMATAGVFEELLRTGVLDPQSILGQAAAGRDDWHGTLPGISEMPDVAEVVERAQREAAREAALSGASELEISYVVGRLMGFADAQHDGGQQ